MRCSIEPADELAALWVAAHARRADRAEFEASSGRSALQVVEDAMASAHRAWAGYADGEPVCVFGVSPWSWVAGVGVPWMVGTDRLDRAARALLRCSLPAVEVMHTSFPELVNYVDARNVRAIRWLRWLGFTIEPAAPHGIAGLPFHRFRRVSCV